MIIIVIMCLITLAALAAVIYGFWILPELDEMSAVSVQTLEVDDNSIPSAAHVALNPPNLPPFEPTFTNTQVKPIKGSPGWSSITTTINGRAYRWDMEDEAAKELEERLR